MYASFQVFMFIKPLNTKWYINLAVSLIENTLPPHTHTYTTQTFKAEIYISMKLGHLSFLKNILAPQSLKYDT